MSRRDTIIIAVLLNAGLLIILFATSLKTGKGETPTGDVVVVSPQEMTPPAVVDEVDQMLKKYTPPQTNFVTDLQTISSPGSVVTPLTPPPTAEIVAPAESNFKEHKVKKGEVLERIARLHHVSVDEIMKINGLTTARLKIGQTLKIPGKSGIKAAEVAVKEGSAKYYMVKNGDNPWTIAVKNHMKVEELLKLNNLDEEKARRLKPGDQIRIQ